MTDDNNMAAKVLNVYTMKQICTVGLVPSYFYIVTFDLGKFFFFLLNFD